MDEFGLVKEQFNNLTGDIELNPASFGLFMRDIEEASLNLKTAIYSGNINLTADFYKQISKIAEKKYALISPDGTLSGNYYERYLTENGELADYTMDGKSPGLYMDHQRLGYWNGTDWKAFIANDGSAFFGSNLIDHYLYWNGSVLKVRGDIEARSISADAVITNTIRGGKTSYSDSTAGYWLGLDGTTPKFNLGNSTNSLNWTGTQLNIKGNIEAATFKGSLLYDSISSPSLEQGRTWCEGTKDSSGNIIPSQKVLHGYFGGLSVKQQLSTNAMVLDEILSLTNFGGVVDLYEEYNLYHWYKPRFIECNISFKNSTGTVQGISIGKYNVISGESNFIFYQNSGIDLSGSSSGSGFKIGGNAYLPSNRDIEVIVYSTNDYQTVMQLKCKPGFQITGKFYLIG